MMLRRYHDANAPQEPAAGRSRKRKPPKTTSEPELVEPTTPVPTEPEPVTPPEPPKE